MYAFTGLDSLLFDCANEIMDAFVANQEYRALHGTGNTMLRTKEYFDVRNHLHSRFKAHTLHNIYSTTDKVWEEQENKYNKHARELLDKAIDKLNSISIAQWRVQYGVDNNNMSTDEHCKVSVDTRCMSGPQYCKYKGLAFSRKEANKRKKNSQYKVCASWDAYPGTVGKCISTQHVNRCMPMKYRKYSDTALPLVLGQVIYNRYTYMPDIVINKGVSSEDYTKNAIKGTVIVDPYTNPTEENLLKVNNIMQLTVEVASKVTVNIDALLGIIVDETIEDDENIEDEIEDEIDDEIDSADDNST